MDYSMTEPKGLHGYISCGLNTVCLKGEDLKDFVKVLDNANVFEFDTNTDNQIVIGININDLYKSI